MKKLLLFLTLALALVLPVRTFAEPMRDVTFDLSNEPSDFNMTKQATTPSGEKFNISISVAVGNGQNPPVTRSGHTRWNPRNIIKVTSSKADMITMVEIVTTNEKSY